MQEGVGSRVCQTVMKQINRWVNEVFLLSSSFILQTRAAQCDSKRHVFRGPGDMSEVRTTLCSFSKRNVDRFCPRNLHSKGQFWIFLLKSYFSFFTIFCSIRYRFFAYVENCTVTWYVMSPPYNNIFVFLVLSNKCVTRLLVTCFQQLRMSDTLIGDTIHWPILSLSNPVMNLSCQGSMSMCMGEWPLQCGLKITKKER